MLTVLFLLIGAIYGSFLNMLLWRLPRGEGIGGRSQCPACHRQIAGHDLVPIFSYLFLGGRCRSCKQPIPLRYLLVEVVSATVLGLYGFVAAPLLAVFPMVIGAAILLVLVSLFFFDLYFFILPDAIVVPAVFAMIPYAVFFGPTPVSYVLTALISGLFFGILYVASKGRWLGLGDVKLVVLLGLIFGYPMTYLIVVAAVWLGALTGLGMIAAGKATMKNALPFGAFLCSAGIVAIILQHELIHLQLFFR